MSKRINLGSDANVIAHNRCCECDYEWRDKPTGFARYPDCPRCGATYWEWVNYAQPDP